MNNQHKQQTKQPTTPHEDLNHLRCYWVGNVQAKTLRDSLEAQVRSWRAKADAAEKRLAEERERRRGLEAGEESRDNLADLVKARARNEIREGGVA